MKLIIRLSCTLALIFISISNVHALSASSAIVMEQGSGRIIYEHNVDEVRSIASITKLMTALVAIEHTPDLQSVVTIQPESCGIEGSSLYLRAGEEATLEELLYGLMLRSGNDAAHAIALYTAGSVEDFAILMNEKAQKLGMTNSHFVNPNGLEAEGHHSTARDMAILGCACLDNEILAQIVATKTISFGDRIFQNHNKLLWQYEGCVGMKTGFTEAAGRTLVSAATRDGMTLVAVTLNAPDDWRDHTELLDNAFEQYHTETVIAENTVVAQIPTTGALTPFVPVVTNETVYYPVQTGETLCYDVQLDYLQIMSPVSPGDVAGKLIYYLDEIQVGEIPLFYQTGVEILTVVPESLWQIFTHIFTR